jgi:hypothetical protein
MALGYRLCTLRHKLFALMGEQSAERALLRLRGIAAIKEDDIIEGARYIPLTFLPAFRRALGIHPI